MKKKSAPKKRTARAVQPQTQGARVQAARREREKLAAATPAPPAAAPAMRMEPAPNTYGCIAHEPLMIFRSTVYNPVTGSTKQLGQVLASFKLVDETGVVQIDDLDAEVEGADVVYRARGFTFKRPGVFRGRFALSTPDGLIILPVFTYTIGA